MADTFTTILSLTKPEVGSSVDSWGTKLNANLDTLDAFFQAGPALKVANGGTGATTAANARTNLGLGTAATKDTGTSGNNVPLLNGANTWSTTQTFTASPTIGDGTGGKDVIIDGGAGNGRSVIYRSGGSNRFQVGLSATAESGSNAGSNFLIQSYTDAGAVLDTVLSVARSTGIATFKELALTNPLAVAQGGTGATAAGAARTNLGLGGMATQGAGAVAITGGSITGVTFSSASVTITGGTIIGASTIVVNHSAKIATKEVGNGSVNPDLQVHGATQAASSLSLNSWDSTAGNTAHFVFSRSLSGTIGNHTAVASGTDLGGITFAGSDGAAFQRSVSILAEVDDTVSAGTVPGRIKFQTVDSSGTQNEALRITSKNTTRVMGALGLTAVSSAVASGSTITLTRATNVLIYNRGSTSAALTIELPNPSNLEDGHTVEVITRSQITALTWTGLGGKTVYAPSSLSANEHCKLIWSAADDVWFGGK
jgi:hypothetical protein